WTASDILHWSPIVRRAANEQFSCVHPDDPTVSGISHLLWTGKPTKDTSDGANAVFYGDKAIDRSPCGTGTSARMAQLHAKGKLEIGQPYIHESYIGSEFVGTVESVTKVGNYPAIMPSIEGWAQVTGYNQILVDDQDPYAFGFQVI
ncbi:MAG: proline racemase family protein, partial [Gammaproteobacteria bacterium]|nr:proline racemase family protein [Gammaproteobacteria bacterium]